MKNVMLRYLCCFLLLSVLICSFASCNNGNVEDLGDVSSDIADVSQITDDTIAHTDTDVENVTDSETKEEEKTLTREDMVKDLNGLNVLCIGDSLFDGDNVGNEGQWLGLLATECGWNFTNLARNGWTVAYDPTINLEGTTKKQSMYQKLYEDPKYVWNTTDTQYYKSGNTNIPKDQVDIVLLEGGVNDYTLGYSLGTSSSRDPSEVLGAWNLIVERMLVEYPNATIVFFTFSHEGQTS